MYKIIYWLLIFMPCVIITFFLMFFSALMFYGSYMRYDHITNYKHLSFIDMPVDFSKNGVIKKEFSNHSSSCLGNNRMIVILKNKTTQESIPNTYFPIRAEMILKNRNSKGQYQEYSKYPITSVSHINRSLVDEYELIPDGDNLLEIKIEKGNIDLHKYSQRLIYNDDYCIDGMKEVKSRLFNGIFLLIIALAIVLLNTYLIYAQKKKDSHGT